MNTTLIALAAGIGARYGGGIKQLEPVGPNGELIILPEIIDGLIHTERATVKVLPTVDSWFGVTYQGDKKTVIDAFAGLVACGQYKAHLFDDSV